MSGFELRQVAAIYAGGVIGALGRVGLAEVSPQGGLSLVAGFAAVTLGHWLGAAL